MSERCTLCLGLGRVADAPCRLCKGSGLAPEATVKCPACRGERCDEYGNDCAGCHATGSVLACLSCTIEPVDPLHAPFCSSACEADHKANAKLEAIREARRGRGS
jgi:RecJ-like exonuclease